MISGRQEACLDAYLPLLDQTALQLLFPHAQLRFQMLSSLPLFNTVLDKAIASLTGMSMIICIQWGLQTKRNLPASFVSPSPPSTGSSFLHIWIERCDRARSLA